MKPTLASEQYSEFIAYADNLPEAIIDVAKERVRQDDKWGEQNHNLHFYSDIHLEELGEFAKESIELTVMINQIKNGMMPHVAADVAEKYIMMRNEAVQMAATALAIVECIDRESYKEMEL